MRSRRWPEGQRGLFGRPASPSRSERVSRLVPIRAVSGREHGAQDVCLVTAAVAAATGITGLSAEDFAFLVLDVSLYALRVAVLATAETSGVQPEEVLDCGRYWGQDENAEDSLCHAEGVHLFGLGGGHEASIGAGYSLTAMFCPRWAP